MAEIRVNDKVWVMLNNRPVELVITKIIQTTVINNLAEVELIVETYASINENNNHDFTVNVTETFATRAELEAFVFNKL